ncbi:acyl-CoA dehydrogenase domain protein [Kribbella flavida DSM 17836]|uniref:Acyl-CoA dehydrogenase domain protein n=1 Tax=Kribbella flavida (strain DSM 17836 / JCM 10339 / NBRC 14399) TaxID=479435 RepID=D2PTI2_KRIFD|nr:acyl-CoA dehydrogenase family protein [Kribbella flavida]ADB31295.1 acyl-CoA dehydrogenase domain protein [Kribbella flavida DSM 17836]
MDRIIFGEDHHAFRASAKQYCDRSLVPRMEQFLEQRTIDRAAWLEAGKQGFLGLDVPEQYGGSSVGDYRFNAVFAEELSKISASLSSCFGIHYDCAAPYLVDLGTEEQKQRWLPKFCSGELIAAIGMTEPSGGSDLAGLRTSAKKVDGGWVLNGSKTFITNGDMADLTITAVRTDPSKGAKGITLFAVEQGMHGFARGRKLDKVGQTESGTSELFFEDVFVPEENVLGEVDRGFIHMMERLAQERVGAAVSNIAHATQILAETIEYVKQRKAFGQPVGSFQYNKFLIAELVTKAEVTQAYVDNAIVAHDEDRLTAVDAAKAKWWSAQVQNEILDACVQLHGGYGYMNEYRVARAWRDARVTKIWAGSNEIMKELIGRDLGL